MRNELREAASLIVARETTDGPQILVLERGAGSRFLPGYVAFPGGAVDVGDQELASRWFGDEREVARAAAVRELVEETGLALTRHGVVPAAALDPIHDSPPSIDALHQVAHWVAPVTVPVRFDARFFATAAPEGLVPTPDGKETASAWWVSPGELMREWEAGTRKLYWPTFFTVSKIATCSTVYDLLHLRFETREPTEQEEAELPHSVFEQG